MSWVITQPEDYFVAIGGPEKRLAPNFNGVSQYGDAGQDITLLGDFQLTCKVKIESLVNDMALCDGSKFLTDDGYCLIYLDAPNGLDFIVGRGDSTFDRYSFGGLPLIVNGNINSISIKRESGVLSAFVNNTQIGSNLPCRDDDFIIQGRFFGGFGRNFAGLGFDFKINDGSVYNYLMDDGDGIMRNSGSGPDGVYPNWTPAMWVEILI